MKQICTIVLALILAISLCACGCSKQKEPATNPSTLPTNSESAPTKPIRPQPENTAPTQAPTMPDLETNIPDPTVNSNSVDPSMGADTMEPGSDNGTPGVEPGGDPSNATPETNGNASRSRNNHRMR